MKRDNKNGILRTALIVFFSTILTTLTINAIDAGGDLSHSMLASVIGGADKKSCPKNMVFVDAPSRSFCIDAYEASTNDSCFYSEPVNEQESAFNINQPGCDPVSAKNKKPWVNLAQHQAEAACAKAGKRLPTNEEWYRAALGTPDDKTNVKCNLNNKSGQTADHTGANTDCVSGAGIYDMVGNVWEWVSGTVVSGVYDGKTVPKEGYILEVDATGFVIKTSDSPNASFNDDYYWGNTQGVRGIFRGGYWGIDERGGVYSTHAGTEPSFSGNAIGFRCVKSI